MGAKIKESVMTPFKGSSITKAKGDLGGGEFQQQTIISRTDCDIASWGKKFFWLSLLEFSNPIPKV